MSEQDVYTPIAPTSDEVVAKIRRRTALSLPDDPSAAGMSAETIRRRFWEAICGTDASVLAEMTRIINEANAALGAFDGELGTVRRIYTTPPTSEVRAIESEQQPTVDVSVKEDTGNPVLHFDFAIPKGKQGERGPSGVYVGDGDMPEDASVQIIPDADDFEYYEVVQETGDSKVTVMSQKSVTEQLKQRSNALKGKMSGTVVIITDIAPTYRGMAVKVSGVDDVSAVKVLKTGLNLWDEQWELGTIVSSGKNVTSTNTIRSKNYIPVKAGVKLYLHAPQMMRVFYYDTNKAQYNFVYPNSGATLTPKQDGYIRFAVGGDVGSLAPITEYANNICISVYNEAVNGTYEAYRQEIYTVNADGLPASGAVDGVTAFDPTTTLMTDIEGAVIEVEYNKDINKAFDELKNAILALGGNV